MVKHQRQISKEQMVIYGKHFKEIRELLGWTKKRVADEIGTFGTTIRRWENGECVPQCDIKVLLETYQYMYKKHRERG
jgi:transcriptional regulator with XRE-family HTH domain